MNREVLRATIESVLVNRCGAEKNDARNYALQVAAVVWSAFEAERTRADAQARKPALSVTNGPVTSATQDPDATRKDNSGI